MLMVCVEVTSDSCDLIISLPPSVYKSKKEKRQLRVVKEGERLLKERRRREQEANVARKKREREEHKVRCLSGMEQGEKRVSDEEEQNEDEEWFRKEVGEEPDPGTAVIYICVC